MSDKSFKEMYYSIYGDLYRFHEKHFNPKTQNDWNLMAKDIGIFNDKHDSEFAKSLLMDITDHIDAESKKEGTGFYDT